MPIKNIIFDLGGVIIDIDYQKTSRAFHQLGALNFNAVYNQGKQNSLFDDYETGKISSAMFRDTLRKMLDIKVNDNEFDSAWNAMLLDLPKERLDFIKNLRKHYKVFLFSNTNEIHLKEVFNNCQKQNGFDTFDGYFEKEYYSYIYGKRKPNPDAFISILQENKLEAEETLFIDDSLQHILGAKEAGLHTIHLIPEKSIFDEINSAIKIISLSDLEEVNLDKSLQIKKG